MPKTIWTHVQNGKSCNIGDIILKLLNWLWRQILTSLFVGFMNSAILSTCVELFSLRDEAGICYEFLEISKTLSFHWVLCKLPYADEHIGENKNLQILKALTYFLLLSIFGPVTENGKMWSRNPSPWSDIPWRRKNCYRLVIKSTMTGFCWPRSPILSWSSPMIVL